MTIKVYVNIKKVLEKINMININDVKVNNFLTDYNFVFIES